MLYLRHKEVKEMLGKYLLLLVLIAIVYTLFSLGFVYVDNGLLDTATNGIAKLKP